MRTVKRLFLSAISFVVALIPVWLFIGMRGLLSPDGFFQEFFVLGLGIWLLWALQIGFIVILLIVLLVIWLDFDS